MEELLCFALIDTIALIDFGLLETNENGESDKH